MSRPTKQQVVEWLENPVTIALKEYAENYLRETIEERGLNSYVAYQPARTQENMAVANAGYVAWNEIIEILSEGEALFFEEDNEYDRD